MRNFTKRKNSRLLKSFVPVEKKFQLETIIRMSLRLCLTNQWAALYLTPTVRPSSAHMVPGQEDYQIQYR